MAININPVTREITVEVADLTFVSGTLYDHDTEVFRTTMNGLMDNEEFIWLPDYAVRNAPVTVAGVTLAQTLEIVNNYFITYDDSGGAYSVRLQSSNNNMFDIENGILTQNNVQVIPGNSAGLQVVTSGSGLSVAQDLSLTAIEDLTKLHFNLEV